MRRRRSLRFRVAFAFAAFGAVVSLLLSGGMYVAAHNVGQRLIDETLRAELDDYMARRARNPGSLPPATASIQGYVVANGAAAANIPAAVTALTPGIHEISLRGAPYRVAVADGGGERFFMLFNETRQRARERRFLAYLAFGVVVMTLLSAGGGWWLAGRVIAPVTELASLVSRADPATSRVENLPHDEVGDALEQYLSRLYGFVDRERSFTADVSHELRTPVAVIQGAVEVLREDINLTPAQRDRLARIERATQDMAQLIRALLLLARERNVSPRPDPPCEVAAVVRDSVDKHRYLLRNKGTEVDIAIAAEPIIKAEGVLLSVVVGNLVRNAFSFTEAGRVRVVLDNDRLTVADTGQGIRDEELRHVFHRYYRGAASQGSGIGLSLVKRICDRYGWDILIESREGQGTTAQLSFTTRAS